MSHSIYTQLLTQPYRFCASTSIREGEFDGCWMAFNECGVHRFDEHDTRRPPVPLSEETAWGSRVLPAIDAETESVYEGGECDRGRRRFAVSNEERAPPGSPFLYGFQLSRISALAPK